MTLPYYTYDSARKVPALWAIDFWPGDVKLIQFFQLRQTRKNWRSCLKEPSKRSLRCESSPTIQTYKNWWLERRILLSISLDVFVVFSNHDYNYVEITYWYMPCLCNSFVYSTIQWVCELLWRTQPHEAADKDEHLAAMQTLKADQWPQGILRCILVYIFLKLSEMQLWSKTYWLFGPDFRSNDLDILGPLIPGIDGTGREGHDATGACDCLETSRRGTPPQHSEKEWKGMKRTLNRWNIDM